MSEATIQRSAMHASKSDNGYPARNTPYTNGAARQQYNNGNMSVGRHSNGLDALSNVFNGLNMHNPAYNAAYRPAPLSGQGSHYGGMPMNTVMHPAFWTNSGQMMYAGGNPFVGSAHSHGSSVYTPSGSQYMDAYIQGHDNSPASQDWTPSQTTGEAPTLITPRRDSISSAENEDPSTPSYANYANFHHGGVSIINRSPSGTYTTSTPSPLQVMTSYGMQMPKAPTRETISPRLQMLVRKDPAIPPAVPAPSSPLKPLDRALENIRGETNVYIRGLLPDTTDDMLENWGKRFGDIKTSKSILDHNTGLCKGFGFVRYHNYTDAEDCIRGFHFLGYEVSFARESFYSKLKAIADDGNTNLYVSNLPKAMNEHELGLMFEPHNVLSARILRDKNGVGRGVGFARFESRKACEEVIKAFNNKAIQVLGEEYTVQIRYADTQEQKHLKQTTAAARQFRSAEYEYATQAHKSGWFPGSGSQYSGGEQENSVGASEFDSYLGTKPGLSIQQQRWAQPAWRQTAGRSPLSNISNNQGNISRRGTNAMPLGKSIHAPRFESSINRQAEAQPVLTSAKDKAESCDGKD